MLRCHVPRHVGELPVALRAHAMLRTVPQPLLGTLRLGGGSDRLGGGNDCFVTRTFRSLHGVVALGHLLGEPIALAAQVFGLASRGAPALTMAILTGMEPANSTLFHPLGKRHRVDDAARYARRNDMLSATDYYDFISHRLHPQRVAIGIEQHLLLLDVGGLHPSDF